MKIEFKSSANTKKLSRVRSQISSKGDLKKINDFLAGYNFLDTDAAEQVATAKCSSSEKHCCLYNPH